MSNIHNQGLHQPINITLSDFNVPSTLESIYSNNHQPINIFPELKPFELNEDRSINLFPSLLGNFNVPSTLESIYSNNHQPINIFPELKPLTVTYNSDIRAIKGCTDYKTENRLVLRKILPTLSSLYIKVCIIIDFFARCEMLYKAIKFFSSYTK